MRSIWTLIKFLVVFLIILGIVSMIVSLIVTVVLSTKLAIETSKQLYASSHSQKQLGQLTVRNDDPENIAPGTLWC